MPFTVVVNVTRRRVSIHSVIPVAVCARQRICTFATSRPSAGRPERRRVYQTVRYDAAAAFVSGKLGPEHGGYHDIDDGPTLQWMIKHRDQPEVGKLLSAAVDLRPGEELYDIQSDPACLNNLATIPMRTRSSSSYRKCSPTI